MASTKEHSDVTDRADWHAAGLLYHSLNFFYRNKFGTRIRKLSLDAGCGCPNRDGTLDSLGCVFCNPASFSPSRRAELRPVRQQIETAVARLKQKGNERFIAYFQPGTNTYGPLNRLRENFFQAVEHPDIVGLAIGTRPDCLSEEILDLLEELSRHTWLVVEFGLQTIHNRSLQWMNRGHDYEAFVDAYHRTRRRKIDIGVHLILGLPGESADDMLATARAMARLDIHSVKLHHLYAVQNTPLADQVAAGQVRLPTVEEHIASVVDFLEQLPERIVIERLCSDAPAEYLVGPVWPLNKAAVRAAVEAEFRRRGTHQGSKYMPKQTSGN